MAKTATMEAKDALSGALAKCYIIYNKRRYNFMSIIAFEGKMDKTKKEIAILGKPGKGHKTVGWSGIFTGKAHYNTRIIREMLDAFAHSGQEAYFTTEIINQDPSAINAGAQVVYFYNCTLDGGTLAKLDASADTLEEDISGTFDDFRIARNFNDLPGMRTN